MKILLAAFKQETSSFNPARMPYDMFNVLFGDELLALRGSNTEIAGALDIFAKRGGHRPGTHLFGIICIRRTSCRRRPQQTHGRTAHRHSQQRTRRWDAHGLSRRDGW